MALNGGSPSRLQERQKMYKFCTPPWKEAYRRRCVENLRRNRRNIVDSLRNATREANGHMSSIVSSVMTEEWQAMREENSALPSCSQILLGDAEDAEITYFNSIMDEIQKALKSEEELLLEMYCEDYEQLLCQNMENQASTDELICPICQKHNLLYNKGVIFCKCGMRLNTECDALGLQDLRSSLDRCRSQHDERCSETASYSIVHTLQVDNLLITCESCDYMEVVL